MNTTAITYRCRAESEFDARALRGLLSPWLEDFQMHQVAIFRFGKPVVLPDIDIQFAVKPDGPTYGEILWLVDEWDDGHVMGQTLAPLEQYTEERTSRAPFEEPAQTPREEIQRMVHMQMLEGAAVLVNSLKADPADLKNPG